MKSLAFTLCLALMPISLSLGSCRSLGSGSAQNQSFQNQQPTTPIATLLAQPPTIDPASPPETSPEAANPGATGTAYVLLGEVQQVAPLVAGQMYELQDGSGKIWVLSETGGLKVGDRILLEGQLVYESIPLAGQEQGEHYVLEQEQLEVQVAAPQ